MNRRCTDSGPRLVLIEGLPGSGKSSLAEWLCGRIAARGRTASWALETQRDHPVIDRATIRTARAPGYARRCADRWAEFSRDVQSRVSPEVFVLEGCLFQGTVRFLIEYERPFEEAMGYLTAIGESLAPLHPHVVYLTQTDPESYLREHLVGRKGEQIVSRIAAYSSTTPFAVRRGLPGPEALVSLYASYRSACDVFVEHLDFPVLTIDAVRFDEVAVRDQVGAWTDTVLSG